MVSPAYLERSPEERFDPEVVTPFLEQLLSPLLVDQEQVQRGVLLRAADPLPVRGGTPDGRNQ